jgi:hypothetical protein
VTDIGMLDFTPLLVAAGLLLVFVLAVVGLVLLVRRQAMHQGHRSKMRPPRDEPRWASDGAPQRVGRPCAACSEVFVTDGEATACDVCEALCHANCLARHCSATHAPAQAPFRGGDA